MSDETPRPPSEQEAELERQIRAERKFSLTEAIGRLAGPGMMKGTSPVTCKRQAEAQLKDYLAHHLPDAIGALPAVLLRQLSESPLLLENLEAPLNALSAHIGRTLDSEYLLAELVREADVEWSRTYDERPLFNQPDRPPHPDDPYTPASVRAALLRILDGLP